MKTAAQIANDAKVRLQQQIVAMLRVGGEDGRSITWERIQTDDRLWSELGTYDLQAKQRRAHLNKVAFPDANHDDVAAALRAGNNLNRLYQLALGRAHVAKDKNGQPIQGKRGLSIVNR